MDMHFWIATCIEGTGKITFTENHHQPKTLSITIDQP